MTDKFDEIVAALKKKACTKQEIYRNTLIVFTKMKKVAEGLSVDLAKEFSSIDDNVIVEYTDISEFEFHMKFSGDLLIFSMHSNVITLGPDNPIHQNEWVQKDSMRAFFGHIMIYNFMADSLKYNRLADPGYLVARLLVNKDNHYLIEGVKKLDFQSEDIKKNKVTNPMLKIFIESTMLTSIETDLSGPGFKDLAFVSLGQKLEDAQVSSGISKVGFEMSWEQK